MNIHVVHHVHIHVHVPIQCTCTDSEGQSVVGIMMSLHKKKILIFDPSYNIIMYMYIYPFSSCWHI